MHIRAVDERWSLASHHSKTGLYSRSHIKFLYLCPHHKIRTDYQYFAVKYRLPPQCLPTHPPTTPQQAAHQHRQRQHIPHLHLTQCQTHRQSSPHRLRSRGILFRYSIESVSCGPSQTHRSCPDSVAVSSSSSETPTKTTKAPSGKDGLTIEERKIRNEARASYYSTLG